MNAREIRMRRKYLESENRQFSLSMVQIPSEDWLIYYSEHALPNQVWRSKNFLAQVFGEIDGAIRISVNRTAINDYGMWLEGISWDDLQNIKREIGYGDRWAVEIFPSDSGVVNVANMRHLFVLPEAPAFAWKNGATR